MFCGYINQFGSDVVKLSRRNPIKGIAKVKVIGKLGQAFLSQFNQLRRDIQTIRIYFFPRSYVHLIRHSSK